MLRGRLSNGIEFVHRQRTGADVVSIQCVVWAGSLDERPFERGVAHVLEHMLFKGTIRRPVGQIAALVEGAGGDINAYTTFDRTVYYLTLPAAEAELGFDVLSDAIFHSTFDQSEFEREREVILEEIRRGNDDPGAQIGKKIFSLLYEGSEAGRPIIGFAEEVGQFPRETLVGFWQRWYVPENMSLVIVGQLDADRAMALAEQTFGSGQTLVSGEKPWGPGRHRDIKRAHRKAGITVEIMTGEFEQTRLDIAIGAPALESPDGVEIDTAAYILGGSEASRLQRRIKEKQALVNAIGASAYTPVFDGIFEVSAAADPTNLAAACRAIGRELAALMSIEPAAEKELERAKAAALIGKIHREETVDGVARALVSGLGTTLREKFEDFYDHQLTHVESRQVTQALHRHWRLEQATILILCDKAHAPDPDAIKNAYLDGINSVTKSNERKHVGVTPAPRQATIHRFELPGGSPFIYRHLPDAKMFSLAAATAGGLRGETISNVGTFHAVATLLGLATGTKSYEKFSGRLEDLGAVLGGFSGKDSLGFEMHCINEQLDEMMDHLAEAFLDPVFPLEQWESYRRETIETLKLQQDSPSWICMRRLHQEIFGNHPYAMPVTGTEMTVNNFTAASLQAFYQSWRDQGPWVFAAAGSIEVRRFESLMRQSFTSFKPQKSRNQLGLKLVESLTALGIPLKPRRAQEQAHIALGGPGPQWGDDTRAAVDILINILGGHGGRLFAVLRDQQSLAYSVSPLHAQGVHGGLIGAYIATALDKVDQATAGLRQELQKMAAEGPSKEEMNRAKSYILGSHQIGLQRASSQSMTMALMELYGQGWDDFLKYPELIKGVPIDTLKKVARQWFDPSPMKLVAVGP
jgi:zinc protease